MRCFVYRNLHKEGIVYSIKALEGEFKGRIVGYAKGVTLFHCKFKVSVAGRERVRREKQKNVHAGIEGDLFWAEEYEPRLCDNPMQSYPLEYIQPRNICTVTYNPYKYDSFVDTKEQLPVIAAVRVSIYESVVLALGIIRPQASRRL